MYTDTFLSVNATGDFEKITGMDSITTLAYIIIYNTHKLQKLL